MKSNSAGIRGIAAAAALIGTLSLASGYALSQDAPFGNSEDVKYAGTLWSVMSEGRLVGDDTMKVRPFEGNEPHGTIQEVIATTATVDGHTGRLIVKRNHMRADGLTVEEVYDDPIGYLDAITIMFKREAGYDPENQDWFWAKYLPSGELDKTPNGVQMAGRVAKGMDEGCIACHTAVGGEDLEVLTSR
jgi:hypothetical protein